MKSRKNQRNGVEVLVAEDSPTQAEKLRYLLEEHGCTVVIAPDGKQALAAARRRKPTLVISDVMMPELDGYGLCKAIKSDERLKDIPVMLVTSLSDSQDVIRGLECGADNFIRKPYEGRYLLTRIEQLLMNLELRKNQKMQMGVEIELGGRKHFITSERQQILDLLISTYEQAVHINTELKLREQELTHSNASLAAMFRIAEGLNKATTQRTVCENALERALDLPGVRAGWISILEEGGNFAMLASRNVPPALMQPGAMDGPCLCRRKLLAGELDSMTNILECERLQQARGDTQGLRFHASVPIWAGERALGVMNLVGSERGLFSEEDARNLDAVGNQLGIALARARLSERLEQLVEERTAKLTAEVAERRRSQEEQTRLVAILEATPDFVATATPAGRVLYVNRSGLRMLGFDEGHDPSKIQIRDTHTESAGRLVLEEGIPHAIRHGIWSGETAFLCRDGREIPVLQVILAHKKSDGSINYLSTIARDITKKKEQEACLQLEVAERRKAEEEVRALNEGLEKTVAERTLQLEQASRAKSDFLANMSHELRTPLNSIIGFSEMLKDGVLGELDAKQHGFVADIFGAGTHLLSLINDILDLSKVEAGMLRLELDAVDVAALLKASTMIVREKAAAHRIRLDVRLDPALGAMLADERKLKQIIYNLLSNAVKFTPDGGAVTLGARRCARAEVVLDEALPGRLIALPPGEDAEFLAIAVEDTGVGIVEEHLPKLFEPFTQVDSSVARRQGGTGLGLSLVRRLAELHGGTAGISSRPGAGSRVCVWLPWRAAPPAVQEGGMAPAGTAPAPAVPLALVIEDDDRMAELIAAQLRAEGLQVMRAATAEEGLVRAAKRRPQLITLDIFLPEMDGWDFMRRLRADPKLADTPVVIITVSEDLDRGLALGARRVLQKPFARAELIAALAGLVDARPDGKPACVLVVDDNVQAVELVATALEAEGYRVLRAYGGAEAIEVARRARPDLVILDLMMPEVSGFEVARALRESEHTARIPILVLTAKDLTAEDRARLNGHVSAILAKASFSTSELLAELRRALPKRAED